MVKETERTFSREKLYDEIWTNSLSKTAAKYGIPSGKLRSACIEHNIPLPTNSYWGKISAGKTAEKVPLPSFRDDTVKITYFPSATNGGNRSYQTEGQAENSALTERLPFLSEEEAVSLYHAAQGMTVKEAGQHLHPKVVEYKAKIKEWESKHSRDILANWKMDRYARLPEDEPTFWRQLSPDILPRVYRLLDAIYRAIESLGGRVTDKFHVEIRGEYVSFSIMEGQDKVSHQLTKEEQKQLADYEKGKIYVRPNLRKYDYRPNGRIRIDLLNGSCFRDTDQTFVEERLDEILIALYIKSESERKLRLEREEQVRKEAEENRQRELRRERYNQEVDRVNALLNEADDYEIACKIRQYISALEQRELTENEKEFVIWAKQRADWFDPIVAAEDPVLGERAHKEDAQRKKLEHKWGYRW